MNSQFPCMFLLYPSTLASLDFTSTLCVAKAPDWSSMHLTQSESGSWGPLRFVKFFIFVFWSFVLFYCDYLYNCYCDTIDYLYNCSQASANQLCCFIVMQSTICITVHKRVPLPVVLFYCDTSDYLYNSSQASANQLCCFIVMQSTICITVHKRVPTSCVVLL